MWYFSLIPSLCISQKSRYLRKYFIYTPFCFYYLNIIGSKSWKNFIFTKKWLFVKNIFYILYETTIVSIRYIGKIFRLEKYKKKFKLLLHYPGKMYLIYKNIKIKWRRKKKRRYIFTILTGKNIKKNFFHNLIRWRIPNHYTKRGLYNNIFTYFWRKRKITNTR